MVVFWCSSNFLIQYFLNWTAWNAIIYTNCLYMSIKIIYHCLMSTLRFVKTTLLHTPSNFLFLQYLFTAKHLVIVFVPQNMYTLKPFLSIL